jgi:hypothetical protein
MESLFDLGVATEEQAWAVTQEFAQRRADLRDKEAEHAAQIAEKASADAHRIGMAYAGAASDMAGATASAFSTISTSLATSNIEAATAAFAVSKAAGLAQVGIDTAMAVSSINAAWAAVPPVAAALTVAALAVGGAQAGAIASQSPSFADTPGIQSAGPRGMTANFAPGDKFLAGRDDADLVRQMQRAGLGGGSAGQVVIRDADRHRGRYGRDPMRPPERYTPLRRRAGRIPGRR